MHITNPFPRVATETGLFLFTLGLAYMQNWQAHDVAWSMWITSLITGLLFLYISIFKNAVGRETKTEQTSTGINSSSSKLRSGIFLSVFFTFHFGFFHFVHSQFMISFFPLEGVAEHGDFINILFTSISLYYGFILVGIIRTLPSAMQGDGKMKMTAPYNFVVRNHIMIILLGGLSHVIDSGLIVYLVIAFYFFPFDIMFGKKKNEEKTNPS